MNYIYIVRYHRFSKRFWGRGTLLNHHQECALSFLSLLSLTYIWFSFIKGNRLPKSHNYNKWNVPQIPCFGIIAETTQFRASHDDCCYMLPQSSVSSVSSSKRCGCLSLSLRKISWETIFFPLFRCRALWKPTVNLKIDKAWKNAKAKGYEKVYSDHTVHTEVCPPTLPHPHWLTSISQTLKTNWCPFV